MHELTDRALDDSRLIGDLLKIEDDGGAADKIVEFLAEKRLL